MVNEKLDRVVLRVHVGNLTLIGHVSQQRWCENHCQISCCHKILFFPRGNPERCQSTQTKKSVREQCDLPGQVEHHKL